MLITEVPVIAITGGPCGGKTTALAKLAFRLMEYGIRAFFVPEIATQIIQGGVSDITKIRKNNHALYRAVEMAMLQKQITDEETFIRLASLFPNEKRVIITDRGASDVKAYMTEEEFEAAMNDLRFNWFDVRDHYTAVFHLVSAAWGAESAYSNVTNQVRFESLEEARIADLATQHAWIGAPHLSIIDNSTGFDEKINRLIQQITKALGIPTPLEIEKKFRVMPMQRLPKEIRNTAKTVQIEQIYLPAKKGECDRIRKRTFNGQSTFWRTQKISINATTRFEVEQFISAHEYLALAEKRIPGSRVIQKTRTCFLHENQYFELDHIISPLDIWFLELELTQEQQTVILPEFIPVVRDITEDKSFSNAAIACAH